MRKFLIAIILFGLILFGQNALAFDSNSIVNHQAPYTTFFRGTFDNLVMDFSLIVTSADTVKALSIRNLGSASYLSQINYLKLWADSGPAGFQGMGVDQELGFFVYTATNQSWYLDNLSFKITDSQKFFISADIYSASQTASKTIQMQIPILTDNNSNGSFDIGDFGIFMDSGNNGPTDANITNTNSQVISTSGIDSLPPKVLIINLADGAQINNKDFVIQGLVRDQGNTYLKEFNIMIDGQANAIEDYDQFKYTWSYNWQNISDGNHTISVLARDGNGNYTQTSLIAATLSSQTVEPANCAVSQDKTMIKNDGLDKVTVTVLLKDQNNLAIKDRAIEVVADAGLIISNPNNNSDASGQIVFEVRGTVLGAKTITVKAENQALKVLTLNLTATGQTIPGLNSGDLIKEASSSAVYYYGADGQRYAFLNTATYLSWYADFSAVKIITAEQLASIPLAGLVTYRPGVKLIKIQTDPKVYAVDSHATLRWIKTEQLAISLYGDKWAGLVEDVSDSFFTVFKPGEDIEVLGDYNPQAVTAAAGSINVEKGF